MLKVIKNALAVPLCLFLSLSVLCPVLGQAPRKVPAGQLLQDLKRLNVLGSALYLAAHPDDENTRLIAYLSNEKLYNTAYLAITRGDGGQNLIGPEIREGLGLIRTQELLQARRTDGGSQFFTRANDFGYSKNPEETFTVWDREQVLSDIVWTIRKFRPDVIITRFPPDERAGHGHHTASAILAAEAFSAAADAKRFPEQLQHLQVWQPKRLLWNTGVWSFKSQEEFEKYGKELLKVDVGGYSPLLGKSYGEIAAESRSMHKSQGFGASGTRGTNIEYLQHTLGDKAKQDLFEGINTGWSRVKGSDKVEKSIQKAIAAYQPDKPEAIVPPLLEARKALQQLPDSYWKHVKLEELQEVLQASLGLYLEVAAQEYAAAPGQPIAFEAEVINRSSVPVRLRSMQLSFANTDTLLQEQLQQNQAVKYILRRRIPQNQPISQPYWLREPGTAGMFSVDKQYLVGLPENPPAVQATFALEVSGEPLQVQVPVIYKRTDPVEGEVYRPFVVTPPVFVNLKEQVLMFAGSEPKQVQVLVKAGQERVQGQLQLQVPAGWRIAPASVPFSLQGKGAEQSVQFTVYPPAQQQEAILQAVATVEGKNYTRGLNEINYSHIPAQVTFPEAQAKIVKLDLKKQGDKVAYLMGAGDDIPASLEQIGYQVTLLQDTDIQLNNLKKFDAVILGVRAYNTVDRMRFYQPVLLEYVKQGGNLIVQYNTNHSLVLPNVAPYPLKLSRDRVTVEDAEVRLLAPEHPALNFPNKITEQDFAGWVQERGLYFPNEWGQEFTPILSANDPGEPARDGGLLVARYGQGYYVYTGYSWFRELPAGVPGAYRLFTNLISLGKDTGSASGKAQRSVN